jgi:hypothetical protein
VKMSCLTVNSQFHSRYWSFMTSNVLLTIPKLQTAHRKDIGVATKENCIQTDDTLGDGLGGTCREVLELQVRILVPHCQSVCSHRNEIGLTVNPDSATVVLVCPTALLQLHQQPAPTPVITFSTVSNCVPTFPTMPISPYSSDCPNYANSPDCANHSKCANKTHILATVPIVLTAPTLPTGPTAPTLSTVPTVPNAPSAS